MTFRRQKFQPWYHKPRPQCAAITKREDNEQCILSATHVAVHSDQIVLCRLHSRMVDYPMKELTETEIMLRPE